MAEHPILFSDEMVLAILDGRKTQTRRVIKPQPVYQAGREHGVFGPWVWYTDNHSSLTVHESPDQFCPLRCPYGVPGDRLWVRESWRVSGWAVGEPIWVGFRDGQNCEVDTPPIRGDGDAYLAWEERMWEQSSDDCEKAGMVIDVDADYDGLYVWPDGEDHGTPTRWRPSIHMPRWAARIILEVTDIRVQSVQDITYDDAIAEGVFADFVPSDGHGFRSEARNLFRELWDSINFKRGYGWNANPWVRAITFEVLKGKE